MAEIQFDEFSGNALSSFWHVQGAPNNADYFVRGGQFEVDLDGGGEYRARRIYQGNIDFSKPFDIYCRITLPKSAFNTGNNSYLGTYFELIGSNNGADLGFEWSYYSAFVSKFSLYIYWDSYNYEIGAEWNDGYIDVLDQVDLDLPTIYFRFQSPGTGGIIKLFYAIREPFVDDDWTEIDTGQVLSNIPDPDDPFPWVGFYGAANANQATEGQSVQFDFVRVWPPRGLAYDMLSDLDDVFYNLNEMAEMIVYQPIGGSAQSIRAILLTEDAPLSDPEVLGDSMRIRVRTSDVEDPGRDVVFINGERWNVIRNAGGGPDVGEWELEISRSDQRVL